jgi:hypothetical protein
VKTQYFLSIRYNMPNTMKSRSLSKRRMRSLRRHCGSKKHRRALRSRSLRTRKMHRKLCKGVRRKTARKHHRRKSARKHHRRKSVRKHHRRKSARKHHRRKSVRKHHRRKSVRKHHRRKSARKHRGGDGKLFQLSPANVTERALNA